MKVAKILGAILVIACIAVGIAFALNNTKGKDEGAGASQETMSDTGEIADEGPEAGQDTGDGTEAADSGSEEVEIDLNFDDLPELTTFDPGIPSIDTMGFGMLPLGEEDSIVGTKDDVNPFLDNGKMNYLAFTSFVIVKTYENTIDTDCPVFTDIMFKDGTSLEGLRCNFDSELKRGQKFRYGYVMTDSSEGEGRSYLYLAQE